jgi:hypothetical protein
MTENSIIDHLYSEIDQLKALVIAQQYLIQNPPIKFKIKIQSVIDNKTIYLHFHINVVLSSRKAILFKYEELTGRSLIPSDIVISISITRSATNILYLFIFNSCYLYTMASSITFTKCNDNKYELSIITDNKLVSSFRKSSKHTNFKYGWHDITNFEQSIRSFAEKNNITINE